MKQEDVHILGSGIISTLGLGKAEQARRMKHSGQRRDPKVRWGSRCFEVSELPSELTGRNQALVMAAMDEAIAEATQFYPREELLSDCALMFGSTTVYGLDQEILIQQSLQEDPEAELFFGQGTREGQLAQELALAIGIQGPVLSYNTACTSSLNGVYQGISMLRSRKVKRVLAIGCEALSQVTVRGFTALGLLDEQACKPFDQNRKGLTLGEGAAAVFLELASNQPESCSLPKLLGGAIGSDHFHPTSSSPGGVAACELMVRGLKKVGLKKDQISWIKAHGTATPNNDLTEAQALRLCFGDNVPPFSSLKGTLGHTLAASGVIELVALLGCTSAGYFPGTAGFQTKDPEIGLSPLKEAQPFDSGVIMMNAFGFGGNMISLFLQV